MKEWIKAENQLPKNEEKVWVTIENTFHYSDDDIKVVNRIDQARYMDCWRVGDEYWELEMDDEDVSTKVIAWMEIEKPEPYKKESQK